MADTLMSRSHAFAGLLNRQATSILFQLEIRTALLMIQRQQPAGRYTTAQMISDQEVALAESAAHGSMGSIRPTIHDLERYAAHWGSLIPARPSIRAALAHQLAAKFAFTRNSIPHIRAALSLSDPAVKAEYERQFSQPLESIYAPCLPLIEAFRWHWARFTNKLEHLPPFWAIYTLTLSETVGAGLLALPIAVAGIGVLPAIVLIVGLGIVNMLTIAMLGESAARSGRSRSGGMFIRQIVGDSLGAAGAAMLSISLFALMFLLLMAYITGLGSALGAVTGISPMIWAAAIFGVGLFFITRQSPTSTLAFTLLIGAINFALITILIAFGLSEFSMGHLTDTSAAFDTRSLGVALGVILISSFGHLSIGRGARSVLVRDPSAKSLILGAMAAQFTALIVNLVWVVAINGSMSAATLISEQGTALEPSLPAALFAVLSMGIASIHMGRGLSSLIRERLPIVSKRTLMLNQRGSLRLTPRGSESGSPQVVIAYLGLIEGRPRFRIDTTQGTDAQRQIKRLEVSPAPRWEMDITAWQGDRRASLALHVLDASPAAARIQISTPFAIHFQGEREIGGLRLSQMDNLPEEHREVIAWILRQGEVTLSDLARYLDAPAPEVRPILDELVASGYLNPISEGSSTRYRAFLTGRQPSIIPNPKHASGKDRGERLRRLIDWMRPRIQSFLALSPVVLAFVLVEWQLWKGTYSFAGLMGFAGALIVPLLGGLFPVLLLASARRRGDVATKFSIKPLGSLPVLILLGALFFVMLLIYGLLLGSSPLERLPALIAAGSMLALAGLVYQAGGFAPRVIIEVRQDDRPDHFSGFSITANGGALTAKVRIEDSGKPKEFEAASAEMLILKEDTRLTFDLPAVNARDLKIRVHRVKQDDTSEALPAEISVFSAGEPRYFQILEGDDTILMPLAHGLCRVTISLRKEAVIDEPRTMSTPS